MKTINLGAYRTNPHAPAIVFAGVLVALVLLNAATEWRQPVPQVATPTPGLIYVLSTREPMSTPDVAVQQEIAALKARLAELEARQQAAHEPIYQEMSIQETAPTATPWVADPPIVSSEQGTTAHIEVPADAPRLCTGFHDWRDYDAKYANSPICHT